MLRLSVLAVVLTLATACGDDSASPTADAATAVDAATGADAATGLGRLWVEFDTGQPPGTAGGVRGRAVYVWIEDGSGNYVDTVQQYFGRATVGCPPNDLFYSCSDYRYYDDPCVDWHAITGETAPLNPYPNPDAGVPSTTGTTMVVDGVSGPSAIPQPGGLPASSGHVTSADWDCVDHAGAPIPAGDYTVEMEITWERADGLGHTRPCETYPGAFPCSFRYSATIAVGATPSTATLTPTDWMMSAGTVHFAP